MTEKELLDTLVQHGIQRFTLLTQQGDFQDETYLSQHEEGEYVRLKDIIAILASPHSSQ